MISLNPESSVFTVLVLGFFEGSFELEHFSDTSRCSQYRNSTAHHTEKFQLRGLIFISKNLCKLFTFWNIQAL